MVKCGEFVEYVNMTARNLSLEVTVQCVNTSTSDDCITKIQSGQADLVTLDGGDVYVAGKLRILASMIVLEAKQNNVMPNTMPFLTSKLHHVMKLRHVSLQKFNLPFPSSFIRKTILSQFTRPNLN